VSAVFFVLFVVSTVAFFPRSSRRADRAVRSSRPRSFVTGPLWEAILFVVFLTPLAEAVAPGWVYGGPLTFGFPFDSVAQGLGIIIWLAGGGLAILAQRRLGRFTRPEIEVLADHQLVTSGPYRWIRHPLYTALLMMSAGVALLLLNGLLMGLFLVAWGIARRRAVVEEDLLASEAGFGATYRNYMERTGRFLPRPRSRAANRETDDRAP